MSRIVPRTCTEIPAANTHPGASRSPANAGQLLERFRSTPAYVLLGDPGAGKTTAFKCECEALGDTATYVTARDFLTFAPARHPEWCGKTLFIDGLDERRAGAPDKRTPFDQIRRQLDDLGRPLFRLSCRATDWLGENDRQHLASVAPHSAVTVLRLDPLTAADAEAVLAARGDVPNPRKFISDARARGLDGLLNNPQSLGLLADAVAQNRPWPQSRLQTFEQACRGLAAEHNPEHRYARQAPEVDATLDAAGRLCAMLLITGGAGFASDPDHADGDYLDAGQCAYDPYDRNALLQALSTKLFVTEAEWRFTPAHRTVAEFLGARHLARRIGEGLPAGRVLALITGEDGGMVTELRGLAAWLAALGKGARQDLIERDPIGVVSYGDVHDFTPDEKRTLLEALRRESARLGTVKWVPQAVGALVTRDMAPVLRDALEPIDEPSFAELVLCALTHGTPLPDLAEFLFDLVYHRHRWDLLPGMALDAFLYNCPDESDRNRKLEQLLDDLNGGRLSDRKGDLLGTALTELYPRRITAEEIWNYLPVTNVRGTFGPSHYFWRYHLVEKSSDVAVAGLLDALATRRNDLRPELKRLRMEEVPLKLLARGIERHGDTLATERLYYWLGVGIDSEMRQGEVDAVRIRTWLEGRPDTLKEVIAEIARRPAEFPTETQSQVDQLRYGAAFPPDYGLWCLQQAVTITSGSWIRYYLCQSCDALAHKTYDRGLTLEVMFERTRDVPEVKQILDQEMLVVPIVETLKGIVRKQSFLEERERNHQTWIAYVRSNVTELRAGQCAPNVLYLIAKAYYRILSEAPGDNPEERIRKLFRDEEPLIEAAFSGIRGTLIRDDLPEIDKIIVLTGSGREYRIGLPFQAALELNPKRRLNDRQVRQALAFYYSTPPALCPRAQSPKWYRLLLAREPETVADVLVKCVAAGLRNGMQDDSLVYPLLVEEDHADLARCAALPLLRRFPLRCTVPQLHILDCLLHSARLHLDGRLFQELIAERLSRKSMTVSQRVHWLAIGVIAEPDTYLDRLQEFMQRREQRITHLAEFFARAGRAVDELTVPALNYLIGLLGSTVGRWTAHGWDLQSTGADLASSCVYEMIQRLAILPEPEAGAALDKLAAEPALSSWRATLVTARDRQRVIRRDAGYQHPSVAQVGDTLRNCLPANPGDLAALITDRLDEIGGRIRTANTDDWRQYWNVDQYEHPCEPKPENSCRDALLSDLRQLLPPEVDAQPEGAYAKDRRADVRVTYRNFDIPVEAKKNAHPDLWSAIRCQLIKHYANNPAKGGYGIYLVFWFGAKCTQQSPRGALPDRPEALREQLEATLTEDERRRISVRVIDVSAPPR